MAIPKSARKTPVAEVRDPLAPPGYPDLAALKAEQRAQAEAVEVTAEQLAAWYAAQCAEEWQQAVRKRAALDINGARLTTAEDPRWRRWYLDRAVLEYRCATLEQLRVRGHVVVCPNHGIVGATIEAAPAWFEGLSLRGLLTGEGTLAWTRYCVDCAMSGPIQQAADVLWHNWHREAR